MLFLLVLLVVSVVVCCSLLEVVVQPNDEHIDKDNEGIVILRLKLQQEPETNE